MNNLLAVQRAAASRDHGLHVQRPRHARPSRQHDNQLAAIASTIQLIALVLHKTRGADPSEIDRIWI